MFSFQVHLTEEAGGALSVSSLGNVRKSLRKKEEAELGF